MSHLPGVFKGNNLLRLIALQNFDVRGIGIIHPLKETVRDPHFFDVCLYSISHDGRLLLDLFPAGGSGRKIRAVQTELSIVEALDSRDENQRTATAWRRWRSAGSSGR